MIGKLIKGRGARGLLDYLFAPEDQKGDLRPSVNIVGGTFAGRDPREISAEFAALHNLRPQLSVHVIHEALRLPEGDAELSDETWSSIAEMWATEMGIENYVAISHSDGHIHIAGSRLNCDGSVVSDQHDYKRSEAAIRKIELAFDLTVVESSYLLNADAAVDHHKAPTREQFVYNEITGETPPSMFVSALIDEIIDDGASVSDLITKLEDGGVKVHPNIASTGRMNGLAYEVDGIRVTSKALGKGFTWSNLQKRGLSYEPNRDDEALSAAKSWRHNERIQLIGVEEGDRAAGSSGQDLQSIRQRSGRTGEKNSADLAREPASLIEHSQDGHSDVSFDGNRDIIADDIDALVRLATVEARAEKQRLDVEPDLRLAKLDDYLESDHNRCGQQVGKFIKAVGADEYQVMTRKPDTQDGVVVRKNWSAEDVLKPSNIKWLRSQNANGTGIFIRAKDRRITLLDDLSASAIKDMEKRGFEPSVSIEASPNSFQAWVRVVPSDMPEPQPKAATVIARTLTEKYSADKAAVGTERFGRLPGFTYIKPSRAVNGQSPWVTIQSVAYRVASAGLELLRKIEERFRSNAADERKAKVEREFYSDVARNEETFSLNNAEVLFQRGIAISSGEAGLSPSEVDLRACEYALKHGCTLEQTEHALIKHSVDVEQRHPKTEDYAKCTVRAAAASDWVNSPRDNEGPL